jgi:hypothetical protein
MDIKEFDGHIVTVRLGNSYSKTGEIKYFLEKMDNILPLALITLHTAMK